MNGEDILYGILISIPAVVVFLITGIFFSTYFWAVFTIVAFLYSLWAAFSS